MFYIYSPQGRVFSGPLEKLKKVEKPQRATQLKDMRTLEDDLSSGSSYQISAGAVAEYQAMLKQNSAREAVYHAYQIMSDPVVTMSHQQTCKGAFELFEQYPYQAIPVVNERRAVVGLVSRRNLYYGLLSVPASHDMPVMELLNERDLKVVTADPVTDVRRIAKVLIDRDLDAVPVVEASQKLVGIISRSDVMSCITADPPLSLWC